jgi:hypothetical protein
LFSIEFSQISGEKIKKKSIKLFIAGCCPPDKPAMHVCRSATSDVSMTTELKNKIFCK